MSLTIQISGWWQGWDKIWADEAHALPALLPQHTASSCLPLCLWGTPEPFQSHRSLRFCFSLLCPRSRNSRSPLLNLTQFFTSKSLRLSMPRYRVAVPSCVCTAPPIWVSYTNLEQTSIQSSGSVIRILSTTGPSIHPEVLCLWEQTEWLWAIDHQ